MANLSQESSHSYLVYPSQSLVCSNHPLDYLSIDNQKLFSDGFGEWSEKTDSNLSAYDLYSANNVRAVIPEITSKEISFSVEESENCILKLKATNPHFSNQSLYCNEDQDMSQDEYLESMALIYPNYDPFVAAAIRAGTAAAFTGDSRSLETTSDCYRSMCSQNSGEEGPLGVEQFQLFSEIDDGAYCMENFAVQQSLNGYNKRPYVGGDLIESPSAKKKQCANGTSPRRLTKPNPSPSKDPQSIAAKNRRERISERLKILQDLVPNGTKVDLVTMLEKAITYVKFLQLQVKVLATDEFWPNQGGKAPEVGQVKEAIDAILSSHKEITSRTKKKVDD